MQKNPYYVLINKCLGQGNEEGIRNKNFRTHLSTLFHQKGCYIVALHDKYTLGGLGEEIRSAKCFRRSQNYAQTYDFYCSAPQKCHGDQNDKNKYLRSFGYQRQLPLIRLYLYRSYLFYSLIGVVVWLNQSREHGLRLSSQKPCSRRCDSPLNGKSH